MVGQRRLQDEMRIISILGFGAPYIRDFTVTVISYFLPIPVSVDGNVWQVVLFLAIDIELYNLYSKLALIHIIRAIQLTFTSQKYQMHDMINIDVVFSILLEVLYSTFHFN